MDRLLLHSCCGPCLSSSLEYFETDFLVTPFWFNPNIEPKKEYDLRFDSFRKFCNAKNLKIEISDMFAQDNQQWHKAVSGLENEVEGGCRCEKCFYFRLEKCAKFAKENNYFHFATTLTVSPHKNAALINKIGHEIAKKYGIDYISADLKQNGGYHRSVELSKQYGLYRQKYCGCLYSR